MFNKIPLVFFLLPYFYLYICSIAVWFFISFFCVWLFGFVILLFGCVTYAFYDFMLARLCFVHFIFLYFISVAFIFCFLFQLPQYGSESQKLHFYFLACKEFKFFLYKFNKQRKITTTKAEANNRSEPSSLKARKKFAIGNSDNHIK